MQLRAPQWLRNRAPLRLRQWAHGRRLWRSREEGIPPSVDEAVFGEVARSLLGAEPARVSYTNVSGYKVSNAYVVWVADGSGNQARFFYKKIDLREEAYPAISGFPGPVGWPEIHAYDHPSNDLKRFLPRVYGHVESHQGMQHEFFLEDLNATHRRTYSHRDVIRCVNALLDLEEALTGWMADGSDGTSVRYDRSFPTAFLDYARESLEDYVRATDDEVYLDLLRRWPDIARRYLLETPDEAHDRIHGDYRVANIFHDRGNPDRIRVVDLEYAGHGWIHNDLASLFKRRYKELAEEGVSIVAARQPGWSKTEHLRMYQRCLLERGLLDAALLSRQRLAFESNPHLPANHALLIVSAVSALDGGASS